MHIEDTSKLLLLEFTFLKQPYTQKLLFSLRWMAYRKKNILKISEQTGQDVYVVPQLKTILLEVLNFNFNKKRKNFIETCIIFPIWYSYIHRTNQLHLACTNQDIFQLFSTFDPLSL